MPGLRGETVGRAYVKILADGSGLPRSIKDEMEKSEPIMESSGRRDSDTYANAFHDEMKKVGQKKINTAMNEGVAKSDAIEHYFNSPRWQKQLKRLEREFGEVGILIGHNVERGVRETGDLGGVTTRLNNISAEVVRAQKQISTAIDKEAAANARKMDNLLRDHERLMRESAEVSRKTSEEIERSYQTVTRVTDDWDLSLHRAAVTHLQMQRGLRGTGRDARRFGSTLDNVADSIGHAFGRGARNNFVNLVGVMVGGLAQMVVGLIKMGGWVVKTGKKITDYAGITSQAAEAQSKLAFAAEEASAEVAATGPPGWIAIAVAIGAVAVIAPIAAGALSSLAAMVVAVASSFAFAVAGGVGIFAGLMLPLAGAIGTVMIALSRLDNELKGATGMKALSDQFSDLKDVAAGGIAGGIEESIPATSRALERLTPVIRGISNALGDVVQNFADIADSRAFRFFTRTMEFFLPSAIRRLGLAFSNVFQGFLNIFGVLGRPGGPLDHVVDWIGDIADNFNKWSSSKKGRDDIKEFFDDASVSAGKWWHLLESAWGVLERLFFSKSGKTAGDSIVDSLSQSLEDFSAWLDAHPGALKQWFEDGKDMATQVGHAVKAIIEVFDTLDTPENRRIANVILGAIVLQLRIMNRAFEGIGRTIHAYAAVFTWAGLKVLGIMDKIIGGLQATAHAGAQLPGPLGAPFRAAEHAMQGAREKIWQLQADLRGIHPPPPIKITADTRDAVAETARYQQQLNNIPESVTTSFIVKMTRAIPTTAAGGVFVGAQHRIIGEAGPEAVVPLNRPLSQIDPAVRWLSAIAQGKGGDTVTNNRGVNVGTISIVTPTKDPAAVAQETINRLVAASYLN